MSRILVIKHGALGDIVLATGPFKAIRDYHKNDHITLLTTKPYAEMLKASGYFDEIWIDTRPKLYRVFFFFRFIEKLRKAHFTRVYDLQTSERTGWYHWLLPNPKPEWVGIAPGASHLHNTKERTRLHTIDRQKQQLAIAGLTIIPKPDISWLTSDIRKFHLPERYILMVPGGSAHRQGKRWPATRYAEICGWLSGKNIAVVVLGTQAEAAVISTIDAICPHITSLAGQTNFADIAELARHAICAIGNDTGPMHLIAAAHCPSLVLFSHASDPALCAPRGEKVMIMREKQLSSLSPKEVEAWIQKFL